jgi:membrane protein implicated in regulation of membrane protease activity
MGYGLGIFLLALGLILALAVQDTINNVDLTLVGWILALAGVLVLVLTAVTLNRGRTSRTVHTTTHADGSQTTTEAQQRHDAPPAV